MLHCMSSDGENRHTDGRNKMVFLLLWSDQGTEVEEVFPRGQSVGWNGNSELHLLQKLAKIHKTEMKLVKHASFM